MSLRRRRSRLVRIWKKQLVVAVREKRKAARSVAGIPATVVTTVSRIPATVEDISANGAGMTSNTPPPRARDVELRVAGATLFGRVLWRCDERFGVNFEQPLSIDEWEMVDAAIRAARELQLLASRTNADYETPAETADKF